MTQQNLRELLKQGDPKAIAASINRTLKPKGISAEVTRDDGSLHVTLESAKVPNQMALVDFIRTGMTNLGVESIHTVKVYGRRAGDASPAWEDEIDLMPSEPMLYGDDGSIPDDSVGLDDVEPGGEDYYDEEDFDDDEDRDGEDMDAETQEAPPPKKQFPKWAIPVGILVPVAAIAGLYFAGMLPFASSSTSETEEVPAATSPESKPASPGSKASPSPATKATASPSPGAKAVPASPSVAATSQPATGQATPAPQAAAPKSDPWRDAVNKAQKAAVLAQTAQSKSEWNAVANEWKQAVALMKAVPAASPNYSKAQQKAAEYQTNLSVANRRAAAAP